MYKIALFATACTLAAVAAFDPITVVAGTTSYVLTGTQVAVAVASLGALALAAEGLLLAELSRGRGRRAAEEPIMKLDPLFDSIAAVDVADCGKLLVCHVSAQPQESLSVDESRIARFFQQYKGKVDPLHAQAQSLSGSRPNIILVMTDDQGFGDFGFKGNPVLRTPHLDEMARAGVRLDRFYSASPVCSPTRASVLTGRHPERMGIRGAEGSALEALDDFPRAPCCSGHGKG